MDPFDTMRIRLWRPARWQLALLAAVAIAAVVAVAIVAAGLILIIAPVALAALLAQRFLAKRAARRSGSHPGSRYRYQVIDAEYEVISTRAAGREDDSRPPDA